MASFGRAARAAQRGMQGFKTEGFLFTNFDGIYDAMVFCHLLLS